MNIDAIKLPAVQITILNDRALLLSQALKALIKLGGDDIDAYDQMGAVRKFQSRLQAMVDNG